MITTAKSYGALQLMTSKRNLEAMGYRLLARVVPGEVNQKLSKLRYKSVFAFINYSGTVEVWIIEELELKQ